MKSLEDTISVLIAHGPFAYGDDAKLREVAESWLEEDFLADDVNEWLEARCFEPGSARLFASEGITPEQAATRTSLGSGGYEDTIAYKVSNLDLYFEDALRILGR